MSADAAARARALLEIGRATEAIGLLGVALSQEPDSYQLLCLLSEACAEAGDLDQAVVAAERAIAVDPEDPEAFYRASFALMRLGRHDEAIELALEAVRLAPMSWWTHAGLAAAYGHKHGRPFSRKHARKAMREAHRAVELAPADPDAYFQLGYCAQTVNRRRDAEAAYRRVLAMQPGHTLAFHNLSALQIGAGRPVTAVRGLRTVAAGGRHADLARRNIDVAGIRIVWSAFFVLFLLYFALGFMDDNHWSHATYAGVDWLLLLVLTAMVVRVIRQLPKDVRSYYRRLALHDWLFALMSWPVVAAAVALFFSALAASDGSRELLRDAAGVLLYVNIGARITHRFSRKGPK